MTYLVAMNAANNRWYVIRSYDGEYTVIAECTSLIDAQNIAAALP